MRPKSATPIYATLVPAYTACTTPTLTHAPPLGPDSCSPATQTSPRLTVGTPDANARMPNATGYLRAVRLGDLTTPADDSDIRFVALLTDVRETTGLGDYAGELEARIPITITDKISTPPSGGQGPGTTEQFDFSFAVPCTPTGDTTIGSECSIDTTADTILPGSAPENQRAIWETGQVQVYDGGTDSDGDTTADNSLFEVQGVFAP